MFNTVNPSKCVRDLELENTLLDGINDIPGIVSYLPNLLKQQVFVFVERWLTQKFPDIEFLERFHELKIPLLP
uniref:Uncharacterized protein n=1 Tax=Helianthus annuus TaxID=4232 RepID=A0A251SQZ7_HELAN